MSDAPEPLDLRHLGLERVIGVYLVDTDDGLALFDCGPRTGVRALHDRLAERGLELTDIRHLLLSHIHLDHAGAAGSLVADHPELQVHVSEIGAPHVIEPDRLVRSARRIYGGRLDELYGEPLAVPAGNVHAVGERVVGLDCFPAPGHASHHVAYLGPDGTLYAGDSAGVRIVPGAAVRPHAPPPDVDVEGWERTFDELERRGPKRLALTHFGVVADVGDHVARARETLRVWSERVATGATLEEFDGEGRAALDDERLAERYDLAAPLAQSYAGLSRYWQKRRERAAVGA